MEHISKIISSLSHIFRLITNNKTKELRKVIFINIKLTNVIRPTKSTIFLNIVLPHSLFFNISSTQNIFLISERDIFLALYTTPSKASIASLNFTLFSTTLYAS
jgi:hypothetical protein